jgi:hypothetical protein
MLEFYTEPNVEQAFKTLIENFSNSLLNDKRLEANDLLVNQQFNHNNNFRKNWGKDELIFFAKILYFYVTEKKGVLKPKTLFDQNFYTLYFRNEEQRCKIANCENNCRTLNDLREKYKNMRDTWSDKKGWYRCNDYKQGFNHLEEYLFSQLQNTLQEKNLWNINKDSNVKESDDGNVRIYIIMIMMLIMLILIMPRDDN